MPKPFALTSKLLAKHGLAGRVVAAPAAILGGMVQLLAERPAHSTPWALQGRRADAQVWAPLLARPAKAAPGVPPDSDTDPDLEEESSSAPPSATGPVIRVVSVRGLLSAEAQNWGCGFTDGYHGAGGIVDRMASAHTDPRCVAIVFDATGPGGDATGCMEAAASLRAMREASGKPVLVWTMEATSAYYALACAAASEGGFYVSAGADVGNVGTRTWHVDRSKANEEDGLKVTHFGSPAGKILGNPDEPLDPEAARRIQRDIDESTAAFVALVTTSRPQLSAAATLSLDADWRRGPAAVEAGLADGVAGSLAEVVALAYGRAMALAAPIVVTSFAGAPGDEDEDMKLSPAALSALGLAPGATSAAVEAAILARPVATLDTTTADPLRALGAVTLDALGGGDVVEALVEAPRRLARGATAPAVEVERDELRREKAWSGAITAGAFTAGEVWRQVDGPPDAKGKATRAKAYTPMAVGVNATYPDVTALEARLARLPRLARVGGGAETPDPAAAAAFDQARNVGALSPKWQALSAKAGVDPNTLAARVAGNTET